MATTTAASSVSSDTSLRQQVLSLQQTVEGLAGIVQQPAAQANNKEAASNNAALTEPEVTNSQGVFLSRSGPAFKAGGEFTTIPAVVTDQAPQPVLSAAGLSAGYHLSDHTKTKIWLHKYVDFHDIFNTLLMIPPTPCHLTVQTTPYAEFCSRKKRLIIKNRMEHRMR